MTSDSTVEDWKLIACCSCGEGQLGLVALLHQQEPVRTGGPELFANQSISLASAGM
jgi:hypothetical protein